MGESTDGEITLTSTVRVAQADRHPQARASISLVPVITTLSALWGEERNNPPPAIDAAQQVHILHNTYEPVCTLKRPLTYLGIHILLRTCVRTDIIGIKYGYINSPPPSRDLK